MKYDDLKPRQQEWIRKFYDGLGNEAHELEMVIEPTLSYARSYLRYMSSKYCDMDWAPAWIVKDKSRAVDVGSYKIPELLEYAEQRSSEISRASEEVLEVH